ncbi:MAG: response regulator [Spirochaetales bacterium]|nr:response regulator [Spirochaetales bacterium]
MKANADFPTINAKNPDGLNDMGVPYKVLLIDDSMFVRKQLSQILTSEGFEIVGEAGDGVDGLEMYKSLSPNVDLVTLDITMPRMDGLTCLEKLVEFDKSCKVIMISALGKEDLVKRSLITGAKNYIVKPLDRKKVLERIVSVLKG